MIRLGYVAGANPHNMQVSCNAWSPPGGGFANGSFLKNGGGSIDTLAALSDFTDVLVPFWSSGTTFVNWQVFFVSAPGVPPVPIAGGNFTAVVGTAASPFAEEATQQTINWRTTDFNLMKLVLLDYAENVGFSKIRTLPGSGALFDLDAYLKSADCPIVGRDGTPAGQFISATKKLNDELRKIYRQA
jgi:hypothetical protein